MNEEEKHACCVESEEEKPEEVPKEEKPVEEKPEEVPKEEKPEEVPKKKKKGLLAKLLFWRK